MKIQGNILGLDFGTKRIGVAIGQMITATARPLSVIKADKGAPAWDALDKIIKEWQPAALVVGLPLNMDGTKQPITKQAENFAELLRQRYNLPIYMADERLSTREARDHIFQQGGYRALTANPVDGMAAQIILTSWLEEQR
jgi:putative Holliday junction resolvase